MEQSFRFLVLYIFCGFWLVSSVRHLARADGDFFIGPEPQRIVLRAESVNGARASHTGAIPQCVAGDVSSAHCNNTIMRLRSGLGFGATEVGAGTHFRAIDGSVRPALFSRVTVLDANVPLGDVHGGRFEGVLIPATLSADGLPGIRLRFTLGESSVLFFCRGIDQRLRPPLSIGRQCSPDAAWGLGGIVGQVQWDYQTGRFFGRWLEFNSVLNIFSNGHAMNYLKRHLLIRLGLSADSVYTGSVFPVGPHGGTHSGVPSEAQWQHQFRAVLGFSGLVRTEDSRWEANFDLILRPAIVSTLGWGGDWGGALLMRFSHSVLLSSRGNGNGNMVGRLGLEFQGNYQQRPWLNGEAMGSATSDLNIFFGPFLGINYEYGSF